MVYLGLDGVAGVLVGEHAENVLGVDGSVDASCV